jgi:tRNA G18 (ribose-2'-O)-methylase SpoU
MDGTQYKVLGLSCIAAGLGAAQVLSGLWGPPVEYDTGEEIPGEAPRRLRKAETVIQRRTSELLVVLEASYDMRNQAAVLRTCDCLGIQNVWLVNPTMVKGEGDDSSDGPAARRRVHTTKKSRIKAEQRAEVESRMEKTLQEHDNAQGGATGEHKTIAEQQNDVSRKIARQSTEWLSMQRFDDTSSCIAALREAGYTVWVTVLAQGAVSLSAPELEIPPKKLAVVFGREADGVSAEMIAAADKLVYFPLHGDLPKNP